MGVVMVLLGAALVLLSFAGLDWYSAPPSGADVATGGQTFAALRHNAAQLSGTGTANAYFEWLSWLVLIALIVVGTAPMVVRQQREAYRIGGLCLGLLGAALTYYALHEMAQASLGDGVLDNAASGIYLAFAGFVIAGAGAAIGPWPLIRPAAEGPSRTEPPAAPGPRPSPRPRPGNDPQPRASRPSPGLKRSQP